MNKAWFISAACLLLAAGLMAWGFGGRDEAPAGREHFYALLADDLGTEVLQFKHGAQEAANELGAEIEFLIVARNQPLEQAYLEKLEEVAQARPDGIILPAGAESTLARALEIGKTLGIPVICLFEAGDAGAASVVTDFEALGSTLGEFALDAGDVGESVALLTGEPREERLLKGLRRKIPHVEEIRVDGKTMVAERMAELAPGVTVFALSPQLTLRLAAVAGSRQCWGMDPGDMRVALLADGVMQGLAFQMPYAQGYQAVREAHKKRMETHEAMVPSRVVTRETMYLSENVKLMFPLLQ